MKNHIPEPGRLSVLARSIAITVAALSMTVCLSSEGSNSSDKDRPDDNEQREVTIYRDGFGIPHVQSESAEALMYGAGYAKAQDRLFQMDYMLRLVKGTMAEVFGPSLVSLDTQSRTIWETEAEVQQMIDELPEDLQRMYKAYADGINAYVKQAKEDPHTYLPIEFSEYGANVPLPENGYSYTDIARMDLYGVNTFGAVGGQELHNRAFLEELTLRYGEVEAQKIFDDIVPLNDAGADTVTGRHAEHTLAAIRSQFQRTAPATKKTAEHLLALAGQQAEANRARLQAEQKIGFSRSASRTLVVGPERTADGRAMMMQSTANGTEVHLNGAGFNTAGLVTGLATPTMGRGEQHGWLITTGESDMVDLFEYQLNPANPLQYRYKGTWQDFDQRTEVINVLGGEPVEITVLTSVHGPVIAHEPGSGVAYARRSAMRGQSLQSWRAVVEMSRASNIEEFRDAVSLMPMNLNVSYAGDDGHIEIWHTGKQPIRHPSVDPRLPTPGDGSADWQGFLPFEQWINEANPADGYFHAWNNKPAADATYGDSTRHGQHFRTWRAHEWMQEREDITLDDMKEINYALAHGRGGQDLSTTNPEFFLPFLRAAAQSEAHQQAVAYIQRWSDAGALFEDKDENQRYDSIGLTIFETWRHLALATVFADDIDDWAEKLDEEVLVQYRTSLLLRALQGQEAPTPFEVDYLNGRSRDSVLRETLDITLTALEERFGTSDMGAWQENIHWRNFDNQWLSAGVKVGAMPARIPDNGNENWNAIIVMGADRPAMLSIIPDGQSTFVNTRGEASPHYGDQVERHRTLDFKEVPVRWDEVEAASTGAPTVLNYAP
ncbi:penicillin acylase family protein [Ectopseudomonas oleovorans]|uniref:penicillin acylase family protein n=1 Tax=Ectopseudomonas oleovorans TaxID=301 RepID=UPI003F1C4683